MTIHPNAPPRLIKALRKAGSFHKLADELNINIKYVHELIRKGIEPTDRTEHGRETRARLYLPRRKRKTSKPRKPPKVKPPWRRWWTRQGKAGQENIIRQTYEINKDKMP